MRNGARPRRKSPDAAPGVAEPSEQEPVRGEEPAASGSDDVVELLVRVPIEVLRRGPIEPVESYEPADSPESPNGRRDASPGTVEGPDATAGPQNGAATPGAGRFDALVEAVEADKAQAAPKTPEATRLSARLSSRATAAPNPAFLPSPQESVPAPARRSTPLTTAEAAYAAHPAPAARAAVSTHAVHTAVGPADQVRFARLHLRTGSLLQARSAYEALAANDLLDTVAILDLAEVR